MEASNTVNHIYHSLPRINSQRYTSANLTMESKKKFKTFSEFTNARCLNELLQTAGCVVLDDGSKCNKFIKETSDETSCNKYEARS